jgi:hypothetical protein
MKARMQIKPLTAKTKSTTSPMLLFNPTTPRRRRQPLRYAHG